MNFIYESVVFLSYAPAKSLEFFDIFIDKALITDVSTILSLYDLVSTVGSIVTGYALSSSVSHLWSGLYVRIYSVPSFFNVVFILSEKEKLLSYIYGAGIVNTLFSPSQITTELFFFNFAVRPSALILNEYVCLFIGASDWCYTKKVDSKKRKMV
ncbi:Uncharacterised protein [uncultured Ruminococcus sp.]|nr:Uncharacterised protein [uncultured Ruminococcus sp.]